MSTYRVTHRTTYTYDDDVTSSYGHAHLVPRDLPWQQVADWSVRVAPEPADLAASTDAAGNTTTWFHVTTPHRVLEVEGAGTVQVARPAYDEAALALPWEASRPLVDPRAPGAWRATETALASPLVAHVPDATAYAARSLTPGRPIGEAVTDLVHRLHADLAYDASATTVTSTVPEILRTRAGVCQDFAHLMLAGLRGLGVAARYVSGYLATEPPPGRERVVGADASHAWVAVWLAGSDTWLAVDPTNDQWVDDRYVTVAWGRDYADVPPVKGVIFTEATRSTLEVSVDVAPVAGSAPTGEPAGLSGLGG